MHNHSNWSPTNVGQGDPEASKKAGTDTKDNNNRYASVQQSLFDNSTRAMSFNLN